MASISRRSNGRREIQFTSANGKRPIIRLGKVSQRAAESIKVHIERLVTSAITGYLAVWATLKMIRTYTFKPFVAYRVVVGISVLVILATTWR